MRILVAEDDAPLADFLRQRLVQEQFAVQLESDGIEAQRLAANQVFDLVILDLNLPGTNGLDVLRNIRSQKPDLPVMVVTGSSLVEERVRGLDAGADDSVAKPFVFAELAARIRAVLRRGNRPGNAVLTVADLAVDRVNHTVQRGGHDIELSPKGVCAAGVSNAARGAAGDADGHRRASVETKFRYHDERGGCVHQLLAQKSGYGIRPCADSNRARGRLSDWREWIQRTIS